jgi:hypothetical protein
MFSDGPTDPNSPEFIEAMYKHLVSIGADKHDPEGFKKDYEKQLAEAKAKHSKKESQMSNTESNNAELRKIAALQAFVGTYYVPEFVKTCAEHGLQFESEADLAHALQINGKFAAMVSSGVSVDALIDSIVSNLNVKHAQEGQIKLSLASINHALDSGLESAGVPVDPMNKAASAELSSPVSDEELITFLDIVS